MNDHVTKVVIRHAKCEKVYYAIADTCNSGPLLGKGPNKKVALDDCMKMAKNCTIDWNNKTITFVDETK